MQWYDYRLTWDPQKWNNIYKLHVPTESIWIPDILLYNNADGEPHITIMSDALVYYTGAVVWKPPSIYKSFCPIDIEYFPYDRQSCSMKFGGWSYNGFLMDVRQLPSRPTDVIETRYDERGKDFQYLEQGMDLSSFYPSHEWDLISLTSMRHEQLYPGCCGQEFYIDISFDISLRRKTLFYTVNIVIPCMLIAILTTFVFYLPLSEHKVNFSISILVTLTVFYLVLIELIPPTSLVIPLIGRYLLFTMFLVFFSILLSILTLNYYRRSGSMHRMPNWMRHFFLERLPKYLCIKPPSDELLVSEDTSSATGTTYADGPNDTYFRRLSPQNISLSDAINGRMRLSQLARLRGMHPDIIRRMIDNVSFIADHFRALKKEENVSEEWAYMAMVVDRLMLIIFTAVNIAGTLVILIQAPTLFDHRPALTNTPANKPLSVDTLVFNVSHYGSNASDLN
ncbi:hypothetical protein AB6A40_007219 [Gnathostoma spinigerum]|uniref:Uncharacterized protein n=1 Tax=Gnathostoma spinigerum TaxID=75299 RepID=A0ABD6EKK4_9BILA